MEENNGFTPKICDFEIKGTPSLLNINKSSTVSKKIRLAISR